MLLLIPERDFYLLIHLSEAIFQRIESLLQLSSPTPPLHPPCIIGNEEYP